MNWLNDCAKVIFSLLVGFFLGYISRKPESPSELSLPERDSIFRDSIYIKIDSIVNETTYINREYEKDTSIILSNTDSANLLLFTEYVNNYKRTITNN